MTSAIQRVKKAIAELQQGNMVVLTDHPDRENEGDLIVAAEKITIPQMAFMIQHGSGIVCLSLTESRAKKMGLTLMVPQEFNSSRLGTRFTVSIEAKVGVTTGVSAADRVKTILTAIDDRTTADEIGKPGHIFPLIAKPGGVLERPGHTEGSLDLARSAGLTEAAVLCEVMNPDGTLTKGQDLVTFAKKHKLTLISIDDLLTYRLTTESLIEEEASAVLPIDRYGTFRLYVIREKMNYHEHIVLMKEPISADSPQLVRIHSLCLTGDLFGSLRCDCNRQLHYALECVSQEGGVLIYLNQEGRGIGLFNKIKAYALQEKGFDTIEANRELGLPIDSRQYYMAAQILKHFQINKVQLMTNNLNKIQDLKKYGITDVERVPIPLFTNQYNHHYLQTKKTKLNHIFPEDLLSLKEDHHEHTIR